MTVPADLNRFIDASAWRAGLSDDQVERVKREAYARSYEPGATVHRR
jgi:hypothetical protein